MCIPFGPRFLSLAVSTIFGGGNDGGSQRRHPNNPHGNNDTLINSGDGGYDNATMRRDDGDHNAWYTVVTVTTMTR